MGLLDAQIQSSFERQVTSRRMFQWMQQSSARDGRSSSEAVKKQEVSAAGRNSSGKRQKQERHKWNNTSWESTDSSSVVSSAPNSGGTLVSSCGVFRYPHDRSRVLDYSDFVQLFLYLLTDLQKWHKARESRLRVLSSVCSSHVDGGRLNGSGGHGGDSSIVVSVTGATDGSGTTGARIKGGGSAAMSSVNRKDDRKSDRNLEDILRSAIPEPQGRKRKSKKSLFMCCTTDKSSSSSDKQCCIIM